MRAEPSGVGRKKNDLFRIDPCVGSQVNETSISPAATTPAACENLTSVVMNPFGVFCIGRSEFVFHLDDELNRDG